MIATKLLAQLEKAGCQVVLDSDSIKVRGQLTDELRQAIQDHKPGLMALLREREQDELDSQAREIARVFQERGWVAFSSRLSSGEVVVFVKDEKVVIPVRWQGAVTYTLAELEVLVKPPVPGPEELKQLHEAKRIFEGRIEGAPDG